MRKSPYANSRMESANADCFKVSLFRIACEICLMYSGTVSLGRPVSISTAGKWSVFEERMAGWLRSVD